MYENQNALSNLQQQQSQLQQLQQYPGINPKDVFDRLRECQKRFHEACQAFQRISTERAAAEKELQVASNEANQAINSALLDPTQPQPASTNPGNGRY